MFDIYAHRIVLRNYHWDEPAATEHPVPEDPREIFLKAATELINEMGYRVEIVPALTAALREAGS